MTLANAIPIGWLLAMAAVGSWFAVMSLDNEPPYQYDANKSYVVPNPAPQGSKVTVRWRFTKVIRSCPGTVERQFKDAETKKIVSVLDPTQMSRSVKIGDEELPRSFELPPDLPAEVLYSAEVCVQCNLLQRAFPICFRTPEIPLSIKQQ